MTTLERSPLAVEVTAGNKPRFERVVQLHRWLERRGDAGVATWEVLRLGWTNPSMLAKELVAADVAVSRVGENPPGGSAKSRGARFFLADDAPAGAEPVKACSDKHPSSKSSAPPVPRASTPAGTGHTRRSRPPRTDKADLISMFDLPADPIHEPHERRAA